MMNRSGEYYLKKRLVLWFLLIIVFSWKDCQSADLRLVVLDVGMGQSVLLVEDGHGLLVDTGLAEYAPHVLARMKFYGVDTLDYLVLSHLHADHAAGYSQIREAWPYAIVFDNNCFVPAELHPSEQDSFVTIHTALGKDPLRNCLSAGDIVPWQNHHLQVLWPIGLQNTLNHNSLVLLFTTKQGRKVLIMSDVDTGVERRLKASLELSLLKGGVDLYVAAHHAAVDSCDPDFLSLLQPQVSMVSVGKDNLLGYPSETSMAVLGRYSKAVKRTDEDGEICYVLDAEKVVPCTTLK
jgi:competence protein ComEC